MLIELLKQMKMEIYANRFRSLLSLSLLLLSAGFSLLNASLPEIDLGVDTSFCEGNLLVLDAQLDADTLQYLWSTGDTTQMITVSETGMYSVTVSSAMCTTSDTIMVQVFPNPIADVMAIDACFGDSTHFINNSVYEADAQMIWALGDGTMLDTLANQWAHLYEENGQSYEVVVQVINPNSCTDTDTFSVSSMLQPTALFTIDSTACQSEIVELTNLSEDLATSGEIRIEYGDNNTDTLLNSGVYTYAYSVADTYTLLLIVDNLNGCLDSFTLSTLIHPLPEVSFTGLENTYCPEAEIDTLYGMPAGGIFSGLNIEDTNPNDNIALVVPGTPGENSSISYTYTDSNGCTSSQTQTVSAFYPAIDLNFVPANNFYCIDTPPDTIAANVSGGTFSGEGVIFLDTSFIVPTDILGTFPVTYVLVDDNNCTQTLQETYTVNELPPVDLGNDTFLISGQTLTLATESFPDFEYLWSTGATSSSIEVSNPGFYILMVTDLNSGCFAADTIEVAFATSVLEPEHSLLFTIAPNPVEDFLIIKFDAPLEENTLIHLYDSQGVLVRRFNLQAGDKHIKFGVSELSMGLYFLKYKKEGVAFLKR